MHPTKLAKLKKAGFSAGSAQDFLGLSDEELALIDMKIRLVERLKQTRLSANITQQQLAKLISSSQSRIAKIEAGDPDVSLDLICRALFALGVTARGLGRMIASGKRAA
jgi:DNA-binding XRE family transcriptional regulator